MRILNGKKKASTVVGLDIEAGSVAATELAVNGTVAIKAAAVGPLPPGAFGEGEVADPEAVAAALKSLFSANKLSKQVRLGIANQRIVVRTLRLPVIEDPKALEAAVRFQAQEQMPMPLDQAVLEHHVVGGVPGEDGTAPQIDVVVVAARRDMIATFLDPIRRAGLEPVGVDVAAFGMIRALAGAGAQPIPDGEAPRADTVLFCNIGDVANLAVARGRACLFTRASDAGLEAMAGRLAAARSLSYEHAMQWLLHVGIEQPLETVDGDAETVAEARRVLEDGVSGLVDALRLSLDYYSAQEAAVPVERIVLSGPGSVIAGLGARVEQGLELPVLAHQPAALAGFDAVSAARLTMPFGLALES
ncbi:MAG TPA: type IV pilus assembly protein PilM [Solirubrobacterales bacterium]|nr:type IV pilus assembly protein PilM [Solirubrobacterales bacterium]